MSNWEMCKSKGQEFKRKVWEVKKRVSERWGEKVLNFR